MYKREHEERIRVERNQNILLREDLIKYKTKDSLNVVAIEALELTKREFEKNRDSLVTEVENLGIKLKRVESITKTETVVKTEFKTQIKDSIIYKDNYIQDTIKCISYRDEFTLIDGCIEKDTLQGVFNVRVPLTQIVHRVPKKFLFFKFGTKYIRQEIYSSNPNATVEYAEKINLK
jgi:hypothetical protein